MTSLEMIRLKKEEKIQGIILVGIGIGVVITALLILTILNLVMVNYNKPYQRVKQPPIMVYIQHNEYWQYPFGEVEIYDPSENSPYPGAIPE